MGWSEEYAHKTTAGWGGATGEILKVLVFREYQSSVSDKVRVERRVRCALEIGKPKDPEGQTNKLAGAVSPSLDK